MAEGHEHPFTFSELYSVLLLMVAFWIAGKGAARLTLPSLVGEIAVGMLAGPNCFDIAPKPKALMMFGEVGLLLLFLEAGLDVDMEMLKLVGNRGIMLSLFGSMLALGEWNEGEGDFRGSRVVHGVAGLDCATSSSDSHEGCSTAALTTARRPFISHLFHEGTNSPHSPRYPPFPLCPWERLGGELRSRMHSRSDQHGNCP